MPFSKENIVTTLLIAAIVLITLLGITGAVLVGIFGGNRTDRAVIYIGASVLLSLKVLLGILADQQTKKSVDEVRERVERVGSNVQESIRHQNGGMMGLIEEAIRRHLPPGGGPSPRPPGG